jgi:hypothetical protein
MPSPAEISYHEAVRSLEGQSRDLEAIRSHVSLVLSASGIAIALLGSEVGRGTAFWVAVAAFATIAMVTIRVFWPIDFAADFDGYDLVNTYVDQEPALEDDEVMREIAIHAADDYLQNRDQLDRLFNLQSLALLAFAIEIAGLLAGLALE